MTVGDDDGEEGGGARVCVEGRRTLRALSRCARSISPPEMNKLRARPNDFLFFCFCDADLKKGRFVFKPKKTM
jgi:hypothetical protein